MRSRRRISAVLRLIECVRWLPGTVAGGVAWQTGWRRYGCGAEASGLRVEVERSLLDRWIAVGTFKQGE